LPFIGAPGSLARLINEYEVLIFDHLVYNLAATIRDKLQTMMRLLVLILHVGEPRAAMKSRRQYFRCCVISQLASL